jgi:hypothetical protein
MGSNAVWQSELSRMLQGESLASAIVAARQNYKMQSPIIVRPSLKHRFEFKFEGTAPGQPIQYVDFTGSDSNDGLSWGTAKATIMAAYLA